MVKNCIDCGVELTIANRSKQQPAIRCLECFSVFSVETEKTLKGMIGDLSNKSGQAAERR